MSPTSFQIAPPRGVFCRERESNPHEVIPSKDFKSLASANSAIPALFSTSRLFLCHWSGKGDLNSRPLPWQGSALPLSYSRTSAIIVTMASRKIHNNGKAAIARRLCHYCYRTYYAATTTMTKPSILERLCHYMDRPWGFQLRRAGFEPARPKALAPKASASANSATLAMKEAYPGYRTPSRKRGLPYSGSPSEFGV